MRRIWLGIFVLFAVPILICTWTRASEDALAPRDGLWVSFEARGDRFSAVVTDAEAVSHVLDFVAGRAPTLPMRAVVARGGDFNLPWSWHLEPSSIAFDPSGNDTASENCGDAPARLERRPRPDSNPAVCLSRARIMRAQDCRAGRCVPLRGLYAGRGPAF